MKVNNTNPWSLIGLFLVCTKNWLNKSHEITRICLEHENKITNSLLFYCDMYPLYWTPSKEGIFMRYSHEYKLECIELYRKGIWQK